MKFTDRVSIGETRRTRDGYLVATARVARTGVQDYLGAEVGRPDLPIVKVYRPEAEVFHRDALHSYAFRPVTNNHPPEMVTDKNWKKYAAGGTGGEVVRDGETVVVNLTLMDAKAIADYEAGKRELSMGYEAELVFQSGTAPDGTHYDAIQRGMRMNHLALVDAARGGEELRIGDGSGSGSGGTGAAHSKGGRTMAGDNMRRVVVDGLTVETTEQGAEALTKVQGALNDAKSDMEKMKASMDAMKKEYEDKLAKMQAEYDAMKGKQMTDAQVDALVTERATLIADAKLVADGDYSGKSASAIRRAAVVAKLGDAAVDGKSDAYVDAMFDIQLADAKANPKDAMSAALRDAAAKASKAGGTFNDNGQSEYEKRLASAWRSAAA